MSVPRVLVIEEDPDVRALVKLVLEEMLDLRVFVAESGYEALRLARREQPDLILLDIWLPDLSGSEVAHQLKSDPLTRRTPLIALTSRGRSEVLRLGLYDGHISKPFDLPQFEATVRRHLSGVLEGSPWQSTRAA